MKRTVRLIVILTAGIFAVSSASILIRWAQHDGAPSLVIAAYRLTVATLALTIPATRQRAWEDYAKLDRRWFSTLILSGVLLGLHFATWITSLAHTSVVSSVVLVNTTPLWIGLAAPFILKESTPRLMWLGIALAVIGGIVIGLAGQRGIGSSTVWGNLLALAGAIFGAGYFMVGRYARARLSLTAYLWVVYGTAGILLILWSVLAGMPLTGYGLRTVGWMVALGLVPQLIGHTAINYAMRQLPATLVGVIILGEPIGTTILAILLLHERPDLSQIVGGTLILSGIVLASMAGKQPGNDNNP